MSFKRGFNLIKIEFLTELKDDMMPSQAKKKVKITEWQCTAK